MDCIFPWITEHNVNMFLNCKDVLKQNIMPMTQRKHKNIWLTTRLKPLDIIGAEWGSLLKHFVLYYRSVRGFSGESLQLRHMMPKDIILLFVAASQIYLQSHIFIYIYSNHIYLCVWFIFQSRIICVAENADVLQ